MIKGIVPLALRNDDEGQGFYGASRGSRAHNGLDFAGIPGTPILSPVGGVITKLGYPYGDDLTWRYVQITSSDFAEGQLGLDHRLFYVRPTVEVGDIVEEGDVVGILQNISARYPEGEMIPHCHYEIKQGDEHVDPYFVHYGV